MALSKAQAEAVEIFKELGWDKATPDQVLELPLGSAEQQKRAKKGLATGTWSEFVRQGDGYVEVNHVGVDKEMLGAFAIRLGVSARRAVQVMPVAGKRFSWQVIGQLLAQHSPKTVTLFSEDRFSSSAMDAALYGHSLVEAEVPTNENYLRSWEHTVATLLDPSSLKWNIFTTELTASVLRASYRRHIEGFFKPGMPAPRHDHAVIGRPLELGWISAEELYEPVLFALEAANRPSDRSIWAKVLINVLQPPQEWLIEHASILVAAMSFADNQVINLLAPVLLDSGEEELITSAMLIGLNAKAASTISKVLAAALKITSPTPEVALIFAEQLSELCEHKNTQLANRATKLSQAWDIPLIQTTQDADNASETRGLWQPTPDIAPVPRFDPGPETPENLTKMVAQNNNGPSEQPALREKFFHVLNAVVRDYGADEARQSMQKLVLFRALPSWELSQWVENSDNIINLVREFIETRTGDAFLGRQFVAQLIPALGQFPELLSTPTWNDFRIDPAELAQRLDCYTQADKRVLEADLKLALGRTDFDLANQELKDKLSSCPIQIDKVAETESKNTQLTVGEVIKYWLENQPRPDPQAWGMPTIRI